MFTRQEGYCEIGGGAHLPRKLHLKDVSLWYLLALFSGIKRKLSLNVTELIILTLKDAFISQQRSLSRPEKTT